MALKVDKELCIACGYAWHCAREFSKQMLRARAG